MFPEASSHRGAVSGVHVIVPDPRGRCALLFQDPTRFAEGITGLSVCCVKVHLLVDSQEN